LALLGAFCAEWLGRQWQGRRFDPLSPWITALSLTLLLRTSNVEIMFLAAFAAVGSKFLLRWDGRHFFNPANFVLVVGAFLFDEIWISPGQWGALGVAAVLLAGAGAVVAGRAARLDTTLTFLVVWTALLFGRAAWFGDPFSIPWHQLQSGAILVFAFFMISDPATTPRSRSGRIQHAAAVAGLGFWMQMAWMSDSGPIHALFLLAPLVPLLNWLAVSHAVATRRVRVEESTTCVYLSRVSSKPQSSPPRSAALR
jgi:Na+-transporting NADH:ubiquinone oxidoreductase subunit NqrB